MHTYKSTAIPSLEDILQDIPEDLSNLQLPDPGLRNYYNDESHRIIKLIDNIADDTIAVIYKIMRYNKEDIGKDISERQPIKIYIDTYGGSVSVMWSIVKAIKLSKTPVWTINVSNAMSAGAHILAAGHKRFALPGSTVLIHSGSCVYSGTAEQADQAKKYYDSITKQANELLLVDTKIDAKMLKKKAPFDWYLSAEEALQNGIIDKIVDDFDEII